MRVRALHGNWAAEMRDGDFTQIDVEPGESLLVAPEKGKRAVVLIIDDEGEGLIER